MSDPISIATSHKLMAILQELGWDESETVDWGGVEEVGARELIRNPVLARQMFAEFINRGVPSEVLSSFDPRVQIGEGWFTVPDANGLKRVAGKIDQSLIGFKNMIRPGEPYIPSEELIRRLRDAGETCLGMDGFLDLWNDRANLPREWELNESGSLRIMLFVVDKLVCNGHGCNGEAYLALYKSKGRWVWSPYPTIGRIISQHDVAVLR